MKGAPLFQEGVDHASCLSPNDQAAPEEDKEKARLALFHLIQSNADELGLSPTEKVSLEWYLRSLNDPRVVSYRPPRRGLIRAVPSFLRTLVYVDHLLKTKDADGNELSWQHRFGGAAREAAKDILWAEAPFVLRWGGNFANSAILSRLKGLTPERQARIASKLGVEDNAFYRSLFEIPIFEINNATSHTPQYLARFFRSTFYAYHLMGWGAHLAPWLAQLMVDKEEAEEENERANAIQKLFTFGVEPYLELAKEKGDLNTKDKDVTFLVNEE